MKEIRVIIVLLLFINLQGICQCPTSDLTLATQQEIDDFAINYPGCTNLTDALTIEETVSGNITSLAGLNVIQSIAGDLRISNNAALSNLSGLDNLINVEGALRILSSTALNDLSGLSSLVTIGGALNLSEVPLITNFSNLNSLNSIGALGITDNEGIVSFNGLESLSIIDRNIIINDNDVLIDISAISGISQLALSGTITVNSNPLLTNLSGLENIDHTSIWDLTIFGNSSLSTCGIQTVCDYIANNPGSATIGGNASGCNSEMEIVASCNCTHPDVSSLVAFYNSTNGDAWTNNTGWAEGAAGTACDPCDFNGQPWYGISCDLNNERVTQIELNGNGLTGLVGTMPPLDSLKLINLSDNNIVGGNWNFANEQLRSIVIANNPNLKTEIPDFNLPNLEELICFGDSLMGPIPAFANAPKLRDVYAYFNQLTGPIPNWQLDSLRNISIGDNLIDGVLPTFDRLDSLHTFFAGGNSIEGPLLAYNNLVRLDTIFLEGNLLTGCLPIPRYCDLGQYDFSNNIGLPYDGDYSQFCDPINASQDGAPCDNGTGVFDEASCSCMTGNCVITVPVEVFIDIDQLVLNLSDVVQMANCPTSFDQNQLVTELPLICDMANDTTRINVWDDTGTQAVWFDLIVSDSTDICTGCGHPDYMTLIQLYNDLGGDMWTDKGTNADPASTTSGWLQDCNFCEWYGVECNTQGSVFILNLRSNNLTGNLSASIGDLQAIRILDLSSNSIAGSLPDELGNLSGANNIILNGNQFTGGIPSSIGGLIELNNLALHRNQLTGTIPSSFDQLSSLILFSLADNALEGTIPDGLGDLDNLEEIRLSNNSFSGNIPPSFADLANLRILDLNDNVLTGPIPDGLGQQGNLDQFYLSYNDLEGCYPDALQNVCSLGYVNDFQGFYINSFGVSTQFYNTAGYSINNNPKLAWEGDMAQWCSGGNAIGAPCEDGNMLNGMDSISVNCFCEATIPCNLMITIDASDLCDSQEMIMSVQSGLMNYQWTYNGSLITANTASITYSQEGIYAVTVTDNVGCTDTDEIEIFNYDSPVVDVIEVRDTVCNDKAKGNTIVDFTKFLTTANSGFWTDVSGTGVDISDLSNVDFDGIAPMDFYIFDFETDDAVPPCDNIVVRINIIVSTCDPCDPGGCLTILPAFTDLSAVSDISITCLADIPDVVDLAYDNGEIGNCAITGSVTASRNLDGYNGCEGDVVDTWTIITQCGDEVSHTRMITIEAEEIPVFIDIPQTDITVSCDEVEGLNIPLSYSNNESDPCLVTGSVSPEIQGSFDGCGGFLSYRWKITTNCHDVEVVQTVTVLPSGNLDVIIPSLPEVVTCDQLPLSDTHGMFTNGISGPCGVDELIIPTVDDQVVDCEGQIIYSYLITNPCTLEQSLQEQIVIVRDCGAPLLFDDFIETEIGEGSTIDLLDNDIVIEDIDIRLVDIDASLFSSFDLDENGVFDFQIANNFFDTIAVTYEVCDLACNECATAQLFIIDESLVELILSDIITPNGDGQNDVLRFTSQSEIEGSKLIIFNRWGDKIYEANDYTNDWDASGYPGGIYFYVFRLFGSEVKKTLTVVK